MPLPRSTPAHEPAQLMGFYAPDRPPSNPAEFDAAAAARPLALANARRPPQNRRRVWRACEPCRKKKIKCDGSDPCQCCYDSGTDCVYATEEWQKGAVDPQVVEVYGKRLHALEDLVSSLIDNQQRLASQLASTQKHNAEQPPPRDLPQCMPYQHTPESLRVANDSTIPPTDHVLDHSSHFPAFDSIVAASSAHMIESDLRSDQGHQPPPPLDLPKLPGDTMLPSVEMGKNAEPDLPQIYADDYGMLAVDGLEESRYFGVGGTVSIVDDCPAVRNRIRHGLLQKGHPPQESLHNPSQPFSPLGAIKAGSATPQDINQSPIEQLPPAPLMDSLIDTFFRKVYRLFPIIEAEDFQKQYLLLRNSSAPRQGFLELLYAVLAISSRHIQPNDPIWSRPGCTEYQRPDLGGHFFALAVRTVTGSDQSISMMMFAPQQGPCINTVTAVTLLGMHLAQLGLLSDSWRLIGHAVRLAYEIGLHRSPNRMGLPLVHVKRRCQLWWRLYVMDRLLALHLGRPVAIHDVDSDVLFPSARPQAPGFVAMTHLCRLMGQVHQTVNAVEQARKWQDTGKEKEFEEAIDGHFSDLQTWKRNMLPSVEVNCVPDPARLTERCVLLSSYCSAVLLLFRPFLATPHRLSRPLSDRAMTECFRAAIECVNITDAFLRHVPVCHYHVLHGHNLFVSVVSLLHCRRQTEDGRMEAEARQHSEQGMSLISAMEPSWPMAPQYGAIAAEYEAFTREVLSQGSSGRCICDHPDERANESDHMEPWQDFAAQVDLETNLFPSIPDAAWLSELFHLSPQDGDAETEPLAMKDDGGFEDERPGKRRRAHAPSMSAFDMKR